jgi:hypothetical protein
MKGSIDGLDGETMMRWVVSLTEVGEEEVGSTVVGSKSR